MNKSFKQIKRAIKKAERIALFCHIDPDFDCLSSMYGLGLALKSIGKIVQMFTHEPFTESQKAILDEKLVKIGGFNPEDYDLLISVDTPDQSRIGIYCDGFVAHNNTIKIDHHPLRSTTMAKIDYIDVTSSSCTEIIFKLINFLKLKITPEIATILYCGLSSDTNSYTNTNVSISSLKNGIAMIEKGADTVKVNNTLTRMESLKRLNILRVFYRNFEIIDKEIAVSTISHRELLAAGAEKRDCGGLSNVLVNYNGINLSCMIVEREPHNFDLSMRAMPEYDVSLVANQLNGGGHKQASGGKIVGAEDIESAKKMVIKEMRKYLKSRKAHE